MGEWIKDFRYASRQLIRNPGFTLAAIICLSLGIGANTATFSLADSLLFRMPEVREPERLVRLFVEWSSGLKFGSFSFPDYLDVRDHSGVFAGLIAESLLPLHLSAGDRNERIAGSIVSGNYFSELGIKIPLGRGFSPEEDRTPGTHPVTVIGHGIWQRRFGANPDIIGNSLVLNGQPYTVIGVAPEGFQGTNIGIAPELWVPMMMQEQLRPGRSQMQNRGNHWIGFITGRLKPGVTLSQARSALAAFMRGLEEQYPGSNTGKTVVVYPESEASLHPMLRGTFVGFMALMFAVVGLILILACANVAGLLLARMAARRREFGIRMALGCGRGRLVRQLLAESMVLSGLAGVLGLLLGISLIRLLETLRPPTDIPIRLSVAIDWRVLGFTALAAVLTGILFGLAPALSAVHQNLIPALKEGSYAEHGRTSGLRKLLVVGQVALSFTLLVAAGLTVHSLQNAHNLDPGFDPENLLIAGTDLPLQGYTEETGRIFYRSLRERIERLPGVVAVGLGRTIPLNLSSSQTAVVPEGYSTPPGSNNPSIDYNIVDHGYFAAMGIPVLRGRGFTVRDDADAPPVLMVNESFAKRFWPDRNPIGRKVRASGPGSEFEVVGVVKDGKYFSLGEDPKPFMYFSHAQRYAGDMILHVRSAGAPGALLPAVRREIGALDRQLPVSDLRTMKAALGFALLPARLAAQAVSAFAFLALLLAATGLYGVMAYRVSQGSREIGVRMALGARPKDVQAWVVRKGMRLALLGLAAGLAGGLALAQLMSGLLYGISPVDPFSFGASLLVLSGVALAACYVPARRATRVDPMRVLREI